MGGNSNSTPQYGAAPMGAVTPGTNAPFQGYMQTPIAPITAPQYPGPLTPSPADAAAATRAAMLARNPPPPVPGNVRAGMSGPPPGMISRHSGDYYIGFEPETLAMKRAKQNGS